MPTKAIIAAPKRRDPRWPEMPPHNNMLGMPCSPQLSARERNRPRNGPPIDDWEAALLGRQLLGSSAPYTLPENEDEDPLTAKSVRGILWFCVQNSEGALSRVPFEIIKQIEAVLHDTVSETYGTF